ncbi:hypothetical protein LTR10_015773 [Elasticomyces elasticus]|nr:hypothetical protein LTR10_015773 [Elasticomyces elasticus]
MTESPRSTPSHVAALSRDDYHIGLVFALPKELAAGKAMLDEEHKMIPGQDPSDTNSYTLGRMHEHNVVLACLPASVDGTTAAAAVAVNMLRTFKALRFALMVGIGGGIPSTDHDIRLGDIVVSEPYGTSGGVVQYTKGKVRPEGFERKGTLNMPPTALLTALASLKAEHELHESRVSGYLSGIIQRYPRMKKNGYDYPGTDQDILFCSYADHEDYGCNLCENGKVTRPLRDSYQPEIHFGTIASGDLVIKDAATRNALSNEYGALCVEMEAAGLMNNFPCLVIRGICDYADSHKNDTWHRYAAATAAAFAKTPTTCVVRIGEQREACPTGHRHLLRALQHPIFRRWQDSVHDDLLWISADPGCGKSVLVKSLIDIEFKSTESHTVCYFFFKENELQDKLCLALCAVLHQLFDAYPALIRYAIPAREKNHDQLQLETALLWHILIAATTDEAIGDITCIFDALDECRESEQAELIHYLCSFYEKRQDCVRPGRLKFLITSRPYESITRRFEPLSVNLPTMRLRGEEENDTLRGEIDLVVRKQVEGLAKEFDLDIQTRNMIEQRLLAMEHRTYLWLHLAFEGILRKFEYSLRPAEELIRTLPTSVEDAYEKILGRVGREQQDVVKKILRIVVGVRRALTLKEMSIALGVATARQVLSRKDIYIDPDRLEKHIRNWCGLFVFINHSKIYLIHQTYAEPAGSDFRWRGSFDETGTEAFMGCICVDFLSIEDVDWDKVDAQQGGVPDGESPNDDNPEDISDWQGWYEFLQYSAEHWPFRLYDTSRNVSKVWLRRYCGNLTPRAYFDAFWPNPQPDLNPQPLEVAALLNHQDVLRSILLRNKDESLLGKKDGEEALGHACTYGHIEIVRMLMEHGVDANSTSQWGTALASAAAEGHQVVVQALLDYGADPDLPSAGRYRSALIAAACGGHRTTVEILLAAGASIDMSPITHGFALDNYGNALVGAVVEGRTPEGSQSVVQLLLDEGADANIKLSTGYYGPPLIAACGYGTATTVQQLLAYGAEPHLEAQVGRYGTALTAAACRHTDFSMAMVPLLLDAGAAINTEVQYGEYGTALIAVCGLGNLVTVQYLLDNGADAHVNTYNGECSTALIAACARSNADLEIVRVLLERQVDTNARARIGTYGTALIAASHRGHLAIMHDLLGYGADVNAQVQVGHYANALDAAAAVDDDKWRYVRKDQAEAVKLLLLWGARADVGQDSAAHMGSLRKRRRLNPTKPFHDQGGCSSDLGENRVTELPSDDDETIV